MVSTTSRDSRRLDLSVDADGRVEPLGLAQAAAPAKRIRFAVSSGNVALAMLPSLRPHEGSTRVGFQVRVRVGARSNMPQRRFLPSSGFVVGRKNAEPSHPAPPRSI